MKRRFLRLTMTAAMVVMQVAGPIGSYAHAGIWKKIKRGTSDVLKDTSKLPDSGLSSLESAVKQAGGVIDTATGKIDGIVSKGFNVTTNQLKDAANAVENFSEDTISDIEKLATGAALAAYEAAAKPLEGNAVKIAAEVQKLTGPSSIFLTIGKQLANGNIEDAVAKARTELANANSDLSKFCRDCKPFDTACLIISADLAVNAGVTESGSVGLAVDLRTINAADPPRVVACVFSSVSYGVGTPGAPVDAGVTIGFMKGGPQNAGGPGLNLTGGSFSIGFPLSLKLLTKPTPTSVTYSITASSLAAPAATGGAAPPTKFPSVSLSAGSSKILQTIKSKDGNPPGGFFPAVSKWRENTGRELTLSHRGYYNKGKYNYYSVSINGNPPEARVEYQLYENGTCRVVSQDVVEVEGTWTRDGNELTLKGVRGGPAHTMYRVVD